LASRWQPPGYARRAAEAFRAARPDGNKTAFAEAFTEAHADTKEKLSGGQVGRWLKTLPESHERLLRFAGALKVSWEYLLVGKEGAQVALNWWHEQQQGGAALLRPPRLGRPRAAISQGPAGGAKKARG
jgi:hypothetical protein